jgi:hypothetical protein
MDRLTKACNRFMDWGIEHLSLFFVAFIAFNVLLIVAMICNAVLKIINAR